MKVTEKRYRCKRCGHISTQQTNHFGPTWSWGRVNACPSCPPWAKYPEFGGHTDWECMETDPDNKLSHPKVGSNNADQQ